MSNHLFFFDKIKKFLSRYPAIVAGVIIYCYFLFTTFDFYQKIRKSTLDTFDYLKQFDTLLWMWLLAWVLIKIIQYRSKLQEQERLHTERQQELSLKHAQLATMADVVRKLQHDLNNPITILLAYLRKAERAAKNSPDILKSLEEAHHAAERIFNVLIDFSKNKAYQVEEPVIAKPTDENPQRLDEASATRG